jgi:hypothetical protein
MEANKKTLLVVSIMLVLSLGAGAQGSSVAGVWNGAIKTPGGDLQVSVSLQQNENQIWSGTIDIPMQNAKALPLTNVTVEGTSIAFGIAGIPGDPKFNGKLSENGNEISGEFSQGPAKLPFSLLRGK